MQDSTLRPRYPSFAQQAGCPYVERGISLRLAETSPATDAPLLVHGSFAVTAEEAEARREHLMRAVVLQLRNPNQNLLNLGEDQLLFSDDLVRDGEIIRGYFTIDLFDAFDLESEPGRYWLSASILGHVSEVLTIEVT